ncbi:MAG TPA: NADP-dependent isocitrate dehydrogenase [Flavobacteriales bacterium]|nr:NADP-dependent isocitrate dehydrogenase [Flavobacteriales bacterium]MCB9200427.1 NADP-dependent isocitrate dehydrogenase [Flavobacteriales bacterium]HOP42989.1 NADP-dependent isocitrate dehydrogenase [Flavobacteriales bacterium]HPF67403.1 NADP-dependent isocitrate dehydrogenase [Flavobacteriales bacterium]HPQ58550.1 NADP-dependent isocitrate dehydrogenase [Flavobacteriales bacterium]
MIITVAKGDGIGPEITDAVLRVLDAAECGLTYEHIEVGEKVYRSGNTSGIPAEAWDALRRNPVFLKGPITTPQGGGYKSLNVTIRKTLGLYANVRPCRSFHPFVHTQHPGMDVVVVRENEEDLYAGIEHRQTTDVFQCLKLITIPGSEKIVRYAFEYARANGRKKVTCLVKDNIMKVTDGLFAEVFRRVGKEYPELEQEVQIIDIGTARVATRPERYDVIVTLNLYGDIISDVTAELTGSVGLAGSANIGDHVSMFEAIHGSAPDIAGKGIANPSAMLNAACLMLVHLGKADKAELIQNAWLKTLEDGIHPGDIFREGVSTMKAGTAAFADAVIERLGQRPDSLQPVEMRGRQALQYQYQRPQVKKELCGIDVFVDDGSTTPDELAERLRAAAEGILQLKLITNRGVKVWPEGFPETFCTDHWRCRFVSTEATIQAGKADYRPIPMDAVLALLNALHGAGVEVVKTEHLYLFDGERGFSLGQGE